MSDDIVTRLREYEAIVDHPFVMSVLVESADEIERLRSELTQANNQIKLLIAIETATATAVPSDYKETMWNENGTFP